MTKRRNVLLQASQGLSSIVFLGGSSLYAHHTCKHLPLPYVCASALLPFVSTAYHTLQLPDPNGPQYKTILDELANHASLVGEPVAFWWLDTATLTFMFLMCGWSAWIPWPYLLLVASLLPFRKTYHLSTIAISVASAGVQAIQVASSGAGFSFVQVVGFTAVAAAGAPTFIKKPAHLWPNKPRYIWHLCSAAAIILGSQFLSAQKEMASVIGSVK